MQLTLSITLRREEKRSIASPIQLPNHLAWIRTLCRVHFLDHLW
jgi:hypothetical protein